jgi:hypothetical protein
VLYLITKFKMPYGTHSIAINRRIANENPTLNNNQAVRKFAVDHYKQHAGLNTIQANDRAAHKDAGHIVARNCGGQNKASNYMWEDRHDNRAHGDAKIKMSEMKRAGRR